ncbi:hypothetical protein HanIR_Chr17g0872561 [Helianthus annuus]|nr:hypothetical protein HanIR_Chr17g0872561 [Helianthus annuus]
MIIAAIYKLFTAYITCLRQKNQPPSSSSWFPSSSTESGTQSPLSSSTQTLNLLPSSLITTFSSILLIESVITHTQSEVNMLSSGWR